MSEKYKPILTFNSVQPLPSLQQKLLRNFLGKFVVVRFGDYETFAFGNLVAFQVKPDFTILILENHGKKTVIVNPDLIKVI